MYKKNENLKSQKVKDELMIFDLKNGTCWSLDEVAGFIWERLSVSKSLEEIEKKVRDEFICAENDDILTDIKSTINYLEKHGLITV